MMKDVASFSRRKWVLPIIAVLASIIILLSCLYDKTDEGGLHDEDAAPVPSQVAAPTSTSYGVGQQEKIIEREHISLPSELKTIIGEGENPYGVQGRIYQLGLLEKEPVSQLVFDHMYEFLLDPNALPTVSSVALPALKNEVMNFLLKKTTDAEEIADLLTNLYHDLSHPIVIRDYALQHLGEIYTRLPEEPRSAILPAFLEATMEDKGPISGTALLALRRFAEEGILVGDVTKRRIENIALDRARNASLPASSRATAVQVSARLGDPRLLELARNYSAEADETILRCASIAALGELADRKFKVEIAEMRYHPDIRIRTAALVALDRINTLSNY